MNAGFSLKPNMTNKPNQSRNNQKINSTASPIARRTNVRDRISALS